MGYALRRSRLLVWSWQLCRGMSGNFRVEPVAILPWNQWQFLHGISGNFQMESVATFAWNTQWTDTAARASARICDARGGTAFNTTYAIFPASLTARAVVPIARRSRIPARHGISIRSAASAAARATSPE